MSRFLITGGAGYIGSHAAKHLAEAGHEVMVYDNLSRGHRDLVRWGPLIAGDIRDTDRLREALRSFRPDAVIHFAAFAYVGESVAQPGLYYENNVAGTLSLLQAMTSAGADNLIVSSTCATYGQPESMPITEDTVQRPLNPYGQSKLMMEQVCADFGKAHGLRSMALRYFNACGCDPDGETGERHDPEPHLIPRALMAADGDIAMLEVFGGDYGTPDGTCIRDYIHVSDLASAHMAAALHLMEGGEPQSLNLGTGQGISVRDIIEATERVTGLPVPHRISPRRMGDPAELVAAPGRANKVLNWWAQHSAIDHIISTAWAWHRKERERSCSPRSAISA
ncbi:UDP-glucose 4-epimerase GalE [Aestuariivirga sp.]|uniref:UDP-glucose 4-epimerase GalE n=1 Tax=Aestuariivirga sp. TaxID=2650926 RepID=UPI003BAB6878